MKSDRSRAHKKIHVTLRTHLPNGIIRVKKFLGFRYQKLILFFLCAALAYYLFSHSEIPYLVASMNKAGYFGTFLAGSLLAFGFSAPFGIGFFLVSHPSSILLASIIGGFGGAAADIIIFKSIKKLFSKEFQELKKKNIIKKIEKIVKGNKHVLFRHYLLYLFAGILILTPLPDEIGISMLAGLTTVKLEKLALISFFMHFLVIFIILTFV